MLANLRFSRIERTSKGLCIKQIPLRAREYQEYHWVNVRQNCGLWIDLGRCSSCILRELELLSCIPGTLCLFYVETSSTISSFFRAPTSSLRRSAWPYPAVRPEYRPWFRRPWSVHLPVIRSKESKILEAPERRSSGKVASPSGSSPTTTYNCFIHDHDYSVDQELTELDSIFCLENWVSF